MNKLRRFVFVLILAVIVKTYAQNPPLRVVVESFDPPFVMQASVNKYYGFDIDLIEAICKSLDRPCQYRALPFDQLLSAVAGGQADVAISGITISLERSTLVNFSMPYLISQSRFLTQAKRAGNTFVLSDLSNKTVGVESGTIFNKQLIDMNIAEINIATYPNSHDLMAALSEEKLDYILLDNPSAIFWSLQSSGTLAPVGSPIDYGFGFGIAVDPRNRVLLSAINEVLRVYEKSPAYAASYDRYISHLDRETSVPSSPQ